MNPPPAPWERLGWTRAEIGRALTLVLLTLSVYAPALRFEFLHYGDAATITQNLPLLRGLDLAAWSWAWTSFERDLYQPLTWISHALDLSLFGISAGGHHLVNVLVHVVNTVLVWWVLRRATGRSGAAWVAALLFGLHPLQVQSVAWVSERQGLLAACFGLLAVDRYLVFLRRHRRRDGIAMHLWFAASLLSKPVLVLLPVLLLVGRAPGDFRREARSRWRDATGLLALSIGAGIVTLVAQLRASGLASLDEVGIAPRLANAVLAYARTLRRVLWPHDLAAIHTFSFEIATWKVLLASVVLLLLALLAWRARRRWPVVALGLSAWFVLQLPTVQLVQFGQESTADRFSYLPVLGLLVALVFSFDTRRVPRPAVGVVTIFAVLMSGILTTQVLPRWHDTRTLFEHNLRMTGGSAPIHLYLSAAYGDAGDKGQALSHANEALRFAPHSARVNFAVAELFYESGNYAEAYNRYAKVVLVDRTSVDAYARIGELQLARGDLDEAGRAFHRGLQVAPDDVRMILGMAEVMGGLGRPADRLALLQRALATDPDRTGLRREIAWIAMTADLESGPSAESALRLAEIEWERSGKTDPLALEAMAAALAKSGRREPARTTSERAESLAREAGDADLAARIAERRSVYLR